MTVRTLRSVLDAGSFEAEFKALLPQEQEHVLEVVRGLRKEETLPGPDDVDEIIVPCIPDGWRRAVPNTRLWVFYRLDEDAVLALRSVRTPPMLSDEALAALQEELLRPPPTPYLRPVPDAPPDGSGEG